MVAESVGISPEEAAAAAKAELLHWFGSLGGATARAVEFHRVLPRHAPEAVDAALQALAEEGMVEVAALSDGTAVYHFSRN